MSLDAMEDVKWLKQEAPGVPKCSHVGDILGIQDVEEVLSYPDHQILQKRHRLHWASNTEY